MTTYKFTIYGIQHILSHHLAFKIYVVCSLWLFTSLIRIKNFKFLADVVNIGSYCRNGRQNACKWAVALHPPSCVYPQLLRTHFSPRSGLVNRSGIALSIIHKFHLCSLIDRYAMIDTHTLMFIDIQCVFNSFLG